MAEVIFFPDNKLNAEICDHFNGHTCAINQNTDRWKDGKTAAGEMNALKYNLQITTFLNPFAISQGENSDYANTISGILNTGRISAGLYYRTDSWINPNTLIQETIPSYYFATWQQDSIDAGFNVVLGAAKNTRFPNHGQELFNISSGLFGYDFATKLKGASNLSETNLHSEAQINYFKTLIGKTLSYFSYENGRTEGAELYIPYFLGGRNSSTTWNTDSFTLYGLSPKTGLELGHFGIYDITRNFNINRFNCARTWDNWNNGNYPTQQESIDYAVTEIQKTLLNGGFWADFTHWHSLFDLNDVEFFELFFSQIDSAIGASDAWRGGYAEIVEYLYIRDSIDMLGSFEENSEVFVFYRLKDEYKNTDTEGIENDTDLRLLQTPLSVKIDLTGTALDGQNIICDEANSIRSLGSNIWILNLPFEKAKEGYSRFKLKSGTGVYYDNTKPTLIYNGSGNTTSDVACKFVLWKKLKINGIETLEEISRTDSFLTSFDSAYDSAYDYYLGGITKDKVSNLIQY